MKLDKEQKIIIVCGPTASGKSAFAMELARQLNGEIINCDSMQVYKEIPIITASPSDEDKQEISHHLYNYIPITESFSAGLFIRDIQPVIQDLLSRNKLPIIVGGTGMYISALIKPFCNIPDIDDINRSQSRQLMDKVGAEGFYQNLLQLDPIAASKILPSDRQRMMRAYEVYLQTNTSLFELHKTNETPPIIPHNNVSTIMLHPEREWLYHNCNNRFNILVKTGALEEAIECSKIGQINPSAIKALGLKELISFINNNLSLDEAIVLSQIKTRQYAKRQITWFNNQIQDKITLKYSNQAQLLQHLPNIVEQYE